MAFHPYSRHEVETVLAEPWDSLEPGTQIDGAKKARMIPAIGT